MGMFAKSIWIISALVTGSLMLGACGGGGSDSGSGSSGNFAGRYTGQDNLFQTGAGANNQRLQPRRITAVINANDEITINDGNNVFRGRLNGFTYTLRMQLTPRFLANYNDVCSASLTHSGTVASGVIDGRYTQDGTCDRLGRVVVSGNYRLTSGRVPARTSVDTPAGGSTLAGWAN